MKYKLLSFLLLFFFVLGFCQSEKNDKVNTKNEINFKLHKMWETDPEKAIFFSIRIPREWDIKKSQNFRSIQFRTPEIDKQDPWSEISISMVLSCPIEIKDRKLCIEACAKRYFGEETFKSIIVKKISETQVWYISKSEVKGKKRFQYRYYMTDPEYKNIVFADIVLFNENQKFADQYKEACNTLKFVKK